MAAAACDLLERASELAALDAATAAALSGAGRAVLVEGSAGIGKTRLLACTQQRCRDAGLRVLSARASEFEGGFAWGVVRQLFQRPLTDLPSAERAELLGDAAALAGPALGSSETAGADQDASFATLHGLFWVTVNLAERAPVVLAVDDAHWADMPSLRFLTFLIPRLEGLPVLLVLTARPPEQAAPQAADLLSRLSCDPLVALVRPSPLSAPACGALVRGALGAGAAPEFCSACHEMTGGNPFLISELVAELVADGIPPTAGNADRVRQTTPEVVSRSVLLRLARVPRQAAMLARALAVLGPEASLGSACALAGVDEGNVSTVVGALTDAAILADEAPPEFLHPLLRSAVLDDLGASERARLHRRAADLLAAEGATADRLAIHLIASAPAGDPGVVATLRQAARLAAERAAPEAAIACLRRALLEPPADDLQPQLLLELGEVQSHLNPADACEQLEQALVLAEQQPLRGLIALALGRALVLSNRFADGAEVLERCLSEVAADASPLRSALEAEFLNAARWDLATRPRTYELIKGLKRRAARNDPLDPRLLANLAVELCVEGRDRDHAVDYARRAVAASELMAPEASATFPQAISVLVAADLHDEARDAADAWLETAQRHGWPLVSALAANARALAAIHVGAVSETIAYARQSLSPDVEAWVPPFGIGFLIEALGERGKLDEASAELTRRGLDGELPVAWPLTVLRYYRARFHAACGRHTEALAESLRCGELFEAWGVRNPALVPWRSSAARSLVAVGDYERARELAKEEVTLARAWGASRGIGIALCAAGIAERGKAQLEFLAEAVVALERAPDPLALAGALQALGAAQRRSGGRGEARVQLRRALDLAHRQGSGSLAERAREELKIAGGRPRREALAGRDALTPSELRVAQMAASGMTNREIAQALFVTLRTVELHLTSTYAKLGIKSRAQLGGALEA